MVKAVIWMVLMWSVLILLAVFWVETANGRFVVLLAGVGAMLGLALKTSLDRRRSRS